jgi:adenylate kinase family enzyme
VNGRTEPCALLITGTVGVGKTTIADAVGDLLREAAVPGAVVDVDWLRNAWPPPPDDRFNSALAMRNLRAICANFVDAGATRLVLAGVVESAADRDAHAQAVGVPMTVCRLRADLDLVRSRLVRRHEHHDGLSEWHVQRCAELEAIMDAAAVADSVVEVTRATPSEAAAEILRRVGWADARSRGVGHRVATTTRDLHVERATRIELA